MNDRMASTVLSVRRLSHQWKWWAVLSHTINLSTARWLSLIAFQVWNRSEHRLSKCHFRCLNRLHSYFKPHLLCLNYVIWMYVTGVYVCVYRRMSVGCITNRRVPLITHCDVDPLGYCVDEENRETSFLALQVRVHALILWCITRGSPIERWLRYMYCYAWYVVRVAFLKVSAHDDVRREVTEPDIPSTFPSISFNLFSGSCPFPSFPSPAFRHQDPFMSKSLVPILSTATGPKWARCR